MSLLNFPEVSKQNVVFGQVTAIGKKSPNCNQSCKIKEYQQNPLLTLISSRSKLLRIILLRFQIIGGLCIPWIEHVRTALCPTVAVVTLTF